MATSPFAKFAAVLFFAVALAHVARIAFGVPVAVGDAGLPMAVSWVAAVVFAALGAWGWRSGR